MYVDDRIGGLQGELNPQGLINSQIVIHSHAFWFAVTILKWRPARESNPVQGIWNPLCYRNTCRPLFGAKRRDRTADTRIFNPLLYHLSYRGILFGTHGEIRTRTVQDLNLLPPTNCATWALYNRIRFYSALLTELPLD